MRVAVACGGGKSPVISIMATSQTIELWDEILTNEEKIQSQFKWTNRIHSPQKRPAACFMALNEKKKSCPLKRQPAFTHEQQLPVLVPTKASWQQ